jgi:hypothetical protein
MRQTRRPLAKVSCSLGRRRRWCTTVASSSRSSTTSSGSSGAPPAPRIGRTTSSRSPHASPWLKLLWKAVEHHVRRIARVRCVLSTLRMKFEVKRQLFIGIFAPHRRGLGDELDLVSSTIPTRFGWRKLKRGNILLVRLTPGEEWLNVGLTGVRAPDAGPALGQYGQGKSAQG